jgi:hypothetical protein
MQQSHSRGFEPGLFKRYSYCVGAAILPWIEANGASLHYKLEGKAGPTVVLLHEIGGSLDSWDGIVPDLSRSEGLPL